MAKRGRKPLWDELNMDDKLDAVRGWSMEGSTDIEMCEMLGISHDTFYKWKNNKPEFAEAVKKGKEIANGEILNSAFQQTQGFSYVEEQAIKVKTWKEFKMPDGSVKLKEVEEAITVPVTKFALPNSTLTIFMMKNRLGYRDKQEVGLSGQVTHTNEQKTHIIHEIVSDPDVAERIRQNYRRRVGATSGDE